MAPGARARGTENCNTCRSRLQFALFRKRLPSRCTDAGDSITVTHFFYAGTVIENGRRSSGLFNQARGCKGGQRSSQRSPAEGAVSVRKEHTHTHTHTHTHAYLDDVVVTLERPPDAPDALGQLALVPNPLEVFDLLHIPLVHTVQYSSADDTQVMVLMRPLPADEHAEDDVVRPRFINKRFTSESAPDKITTGHESQSCCPVDVSVRSTVTRLQSAQVERQQHNMSTT